MVNPLTSNSFFFKRHDIREQVKTANIQANKNSLNKIQDEKQNTDSNLKRETYGLVILELMSDTEYEAWNRATVNMTESEKMLAVQKLYSLADIDRIKKKKQEGEKNHTENEDNKKPSSFIVNANKLNGVKVFSDQNDFIQRYKNAFLNLQTKVDLNG